MAMKTVDASAVQLTATSVPIINSVTIKAAAGNTGKVYVGFANTVTAVSGSDSATDGMELSAGESIDLSKKAVELGSNVQNGNANKIWLIGSASGQKVFWFVN